MFKGSMVAMVTPMHHDGSIDKKALQALTEWHVQSKTDAIIVAGTTGESATLDSNEHLEVISLVVKQVATRIPVIAGAGTNATRSTLKLMQNAKIANADAALVVTPYYNKPTQDGLYQHYKTLAEHAELPIILYNVPTRTACDLLPETVERLSKISGIIGIKEATGKLERMLEIKKRCAHDFEIYSGDDETALALMLAGSQGVISVTANVAPEKMHALCEAASSKQQKIAEAINAELMPLHQKLFLETNPAPAKWALQMMGKIQEGIRLPLVHLNPQFHDELKQAMQYAGVI